MALAAAREMGSAEVSDIAIHQALAFRSTSTTVQLTVSAAGQFRICSEPSAWVLHATGSLSRGGKAQAGQASMEDIRNRCSKRIAGDEFYGQMAAHGLEYGPRFRGVLELWRGEGEALARLRPADDFTPMPDSAMQVLAAAVPDSADDAAYVPVSVDRVAQWGAMSTAVWSHVQAVVERDCVRGDVRLLNPSGGAVIELRGVRLQRVGANSTHDEVADRFYAMEWKSKNAEPAVAEAGRWLVFADRGGIAEGLAERLPGATLVRSGGIMPSNQTWTGLVDCRALDATSAGEVCGPVLELVQNIVRAGWRDVPRLYVVTRHLSLEQSPLWGMSRVIAMEHPELRCTTIGLGSHDSMDALTPELLADSIEDQIVLDDGGRRVARLVHGLADSARPLVPAGGRPFRLEITTPGVLDGLVLQEMIRRAPGPGEVELRVAAAALNFNDVMKAMGIYPGVGDGPVPLGNECAGTVVAIGEGVTGLAVGDEVVALAPYSFGSHVTTPAALVARKPAHLGFEEAASMPVAFLTAAYSLDRIGRLEPGERVLIHSAAGGVGLAAIQIAQQVGAEIFATVGTDEKREYLRSIGVRHVMDSRSLAFADEVMELTGGRGVDVVLNSLAGEAIAKSLAVVAPYGRFLELGKRDLYQNRQIGLWPFRKGLTYSVIDLAGLVQERPAMLGQLLRDLMNNDALRPRRGRCSVPAMR